MALTLKESECAKQFAVIKALEQGEKFRILLSLEKQQRAAAACAKLDKAAGKHKKWIRPAFHMSEKDYWQCRLKYGVDEIHSDEFARFHSKHHPEQCVRKF